VGALGSDFLHFGSNRAQSNALVAEANTAMKSSSYL